jgi:transcription elongation factor Elf1
LTTDKRIRFPSGSYQAFYEGISYKIDPENDIVEMTQRLNPRYSPESREEAVNLADKLGVEKIQKRARLFSKLLLLSILLFLFLMLSPALFSSKSEGFLSAGRFLTIVSEVAFLYMFGYYRAVVNYCMDSYCEKCGKHFVFEEFQAPLIKDESKIDEYTKTLTKYWHCRNCGHEDIIIEPQPIDHHHEKKQGNLKGDTCEECGKEHAIEEYRNIDVLNYALRKKIRYFKCRNCGYHEIRLNKRFRIEVLPKLIKML